MGLHCTKQGHHLPDFSEGSLKRYAPEGESFPLDMSSKNSHCVLLNSNVTTENVALLLNDLSKSFSTSFSPKMVQRNNILIGKENLMNCDENTVELPPEGDISHKEYVELPQKSYKMYKKADKMETVDLSMSSEVSTSSPGEESVCDSKKSSHRSCDDNQWSYTLYNFEGNGTATKKNLHALVDSICSAVGKTVYRETSQNNTHSVKVQLQIGHEKNKSTSTKSPNKYTPSKQYKGMIFPPPNSLEAEKVSSYIEEQLSVHKENASRIKHRRLRHSNNSFRKEFFAQPKYYNGDNFHLPKRHDTTVGEEITYNNFPPKNIYCSQINKEPFSWSPRDSPKVTHCRDSSSHHCHYDPNITKLKSDAPESPKYRLKHSCKHHRKLREPALHTSKRNGCSDQESKLCQQIKIDAQRKFYHSENDTMSMGSSINSSSQSSENSSYCTRSFSSKSKIRHRKNNSDEELLENNKKKQPSRDRPDVWPGESRDVINFEKISSTSDLCICKRMCGLDYPCNHASIIHNHEHHHHHYYLPNSEKT